MSNTEAISAQLQVIADQLASTKLGDLHPFGAESHCFEFVSRRSEAELAEFEARHSIKLPTEYRLFLQQVGDGGAGPAYGLLTLDEACQMATSNGKESLLAQPFPHKDSFRPEDDPQFRELYEPQYAGPKVLTETQIEDHYRELDSGTLPICHEGCGYYHRLVVTGPTRGEMWLDGRVSDGGFFRFGLSFLEWYMRWYDDMLAGRDGVWWLREEA